MDMTSFINAPYDIRNDIIHFYIAHNITWYGMPQIVLYLQMIVTLRVCLSAIMWNN